MYIYPSLCISISTSIYLYNYLYIYLYNYLYIYLYNNLYIYLYNYLYIYLYNFLYIYLYIYLFIYKSICPSYSLSIHTETFFWLIFVDEMMRFSYTSFDVKKVPNRFTESRWWRVRAWYLLFQQRKPEHTCVQTCVLTYIHRPQLKAGLPDGIFA
jgi:hypothetical protein